MISMNIRKICAYGFGHATFAVGYISLVAAFLNNAERFLGVQNNKYLGTTLFLLLFVISAAIMAMLVFGRPLMWYLDGNKKESVYLSIATVGWLFAFAILVCFVLAFFL